MLRPLIPDDNGRMPNARRMREFRLMAVQTDLPEHSYVIMIRAVGLDGREREFEFDGSPEEFRQMAQSILEVLGPPPVQRESQGQ